jgi:hypothetical protein
MQHPNRATTSAIPSIARTGRAFCKRLMSFTTPLAHSGSRTHDSTVKRPNRRHSGAKLQPFAKPERYNVESWNQTAVIADEYPYASSSQGGYGAILRGTTAADSNSKLPFLLLPVKSRQNHKLTNLSRASGTSCPHLPRNPQRRRRSAACHQLGSNVSLRPSLQTVPHQMAHINNRH